MEHMKLPAGHSVHSLPQTLSHPEMHKTERVPGSTGSIWSYLLGVQSLYCLRGGMNQKGTRHKDTINGSIWSIVFNRLWVCISFSMKSSFVPKMRFFLSVFLSFFLSFLPFTSYCCCHCCLFSYCCCHHCVCLIIAVVSVACLVTAVVIV